MSVHPLSAIHRSTSFVAHPVSDTPHDPSFDGHRPTSFIRHSSCDILQSLRSRHPCARDRHPQFDSPVRYRSFPRRVRTTYARDAHHLLFAPTGQTELQTSSLACPPRTARSHIPSSSSYHDPLRANNATQHTISINARGIIERGTYPAITSSCPHVPRTDRLKISFRA
jgi:hypothetical protein